MTIVGSDPGAVIGGVDTHADVHVAAAVNHVGGVVGVEAFPATRSGYHRLVSWLRSHGELTLVGVEGTGSYGLGLARYLEGAGVTVVEVDRPNRQTRHRKESPIRLTQWRQLELLWREPPPGHQRHETATSKPYGCWGSHGAPRSMPALKR